MSRSLVISIHDVAPRNLGEVDALREMVHLVAGEVPLSLLVVPRYHGQPWDPTSTEWLRQRVAAGDEPVVHGLVHMDPRGRDGAEFAPRDSLGDTIARLAFAMAEVRALGVHAEGFLAPAYGHPAALERALCTSGLQWWATRNHLVGAGGRMELRSLGLGASTGLRRASSSRMVPIAARAFAAVERVRLDLHPADLRHARLRDAIPRLLDTLLSQGRRPVVHREHARRLATPSAPDAALR